MTDTYLMATLPYFDELHRNDLAAIALLIGYFSEIIVPTFFPTMRKAPSLPVILIFTAVAIMGGIINFIYNLSANGSSHAWHVAWITPLPLILASGAIFIGDIILRLRRKRRNPL